MFATPSPAQKFQIVTEFQHHALPTYSEAEKKLLLGQKPQNLFKLHLKETPNYFLNRAQKETGSIPKIIRTLHYSIEIGLAVMKIKHPQKRKEVLLICFSKGSEKIQVQKLSL